MPGNYLVGQASRTEIGTPRYQLKFSPFWPTSREGCNPNSMGFVLYLVIWVVFVSLGQALKRKVSLAKYRSRERVTRSI
jgi:hypothetical protein